MRMWTFKIKPNLLVLVFLSLCSSTVGQDFRITKTTPSTDSILVEWSYPTTNEGDVLAFVMTASYQGPCSDEVPRRTDFNYYKESRNWTVRQLQPFGHYMVTVKALPEYHGSSDNTTLPSNTSTLPAAPSSAPPNVAVVATTSTSITIQWDPVPCLQQNSMITAYGVTVRDVNSTLVSSHHQDADRTSYSVTGLHSDSEYSFEVYAIGSSDDGSDLRGPSSSLLGVSIAEGIHGTKPCLSCTTEPCETCHDSSSSLTTILTSVIATVVILLIMGCVVIMVVVYRRKYRRGGHNPLDGTNDGGDGEHRGYRNV